METPTSPEKAQPTAACCDTRDRRRAGLPRGWAALILLAVILFHAGANLWWLQADRHEITRDEAVHMKAARGYHLVFYQVYTLDALRNPAGFVRELVSFESRYPPLLHIAGALVCMVLGYSHDILALTSTVNFALLILGAYAFARSRFDRPFALVAATGTSLLPIVHGASRIFMLDYMAAAMAMWALVCLVRCKGFHRLRWALLFGLANGLAIMVRQTTLVIYLLPLLAVVAWGGWRAYVRPCPGAARPWHWTGNVLAAVLVSSVIVMPWHILHARFLYDFWVGDYEVFTRDKPGIPELLESRAPVPAPAKLFTAGVLPNPLALFQAMHGAGEDGAAGTPAWVERLRKREWSQFPIDLINNCMFLPPFVLAAFGCFTLFSRKKQAGPVWIAILTLLGTWLIWTALFHTKGPRYFLPAVPAAGFLAVVALDALPGPWLRRGATVAYLGFLGVSFVVLTFACPAALSRVEIPVLGEHPDVTRYGDSGLVLIKGELWSGNYTFRRPCTWRSATHRIFDRLAEDMRSRRPSGDVASTYQHLGQHLHGGLFFHGAYFETEHYLPLPNPYARSANSNDLLPRGLHKTGPVWPTRPELLDRRLDITDYLIMRLSPDDTKAGTEEIWQRHALARHFEIIDHFEQPAFGRIPRTHYTLMARQVPEPVLMGSWDFGELPRDQREWQFPGSSPDDNSLPVFRTREKGVGPVLPSVELDASVTDTVRVSFRAVCRNGREAQPAVPEKVFLYWSDKPAVNGVPFSNSHAIPMRRRGTDENAWEGIAWQHRAWSGTIRSLFLGIDMDVAALPLRPGLTADELTLSPAVIRLWDFSALRGKDWEWVFPPASVKTADGARYRTKRTGLGPRLRDTGLMAEEFSMVWMELDVRRDDLVSPGPSAARQVIFYWAGPGQTGDAPGKPFSHTRAVVLRPFGKDHPDLWAADLAGHPEWHGPVDDAFLGIDIEPGPVFGMAGGNTVTVRRIGFSALPPRRDDSPQFEITVEKIELLGMRQSLTAQLDDTAS